ncbi:DUF2207 family protein [Kitasatospora viridis]|uniref:Putative membrane protein DUF2207 n=1 Tax=Kitasatospora viridis TaxID=281105 RepID=A0A561S9A4_9ACTN|nr:DUF2207 domain-containing protein [Kitasatospora viridis]TWF71451.1 putative membrane protein DUF2207 [Kitasatospora viridis]
MVWLAVGRVGHDAHPLGFDGIWGLIALALLLGWVAVFRRELRRSKAGFGTGPGFTAGPPADSAPVSPALAALIVGGVWARADAEAATLLDLAARGLIRIDPTGPGARDALVTVTADAAQAEALLPYERQVLHRVARIAVGGQVPLGALARGGTGQSSTWQREFRKAVEAEGRERGLLRDRYDRSRRRLLMLLAVLPVAAFWLAMALPHGSWIGSPPLALLPWLLVAGTADAAGKFPVATAAARPEHWQQYGERLAAEGAATRTPASATTGDRTLAYAAALGVARTAAAAVRFGTPDPRRAWSTQGGQWHQVQLRRARFGSLAAPGRMAAVGGTAGLLLLGLVALVVRAAGQRDAWGQPVVSAPAAVYGGGLLGALALVGLACAAIGILDLRHRQEVVGELVRAHRTAVGGKQPARVAVDPGTGGTIWVLPVRPELLDGLTEGQRVRLTRSRWRGYVHDVVPDDAHPAAGGRPGAIGGASGMDGSGMG